MLIKSEQVASIISDKDNILILCHKNPDGDTLGSAFALAWALKRNSRKVRVLCADEIAEKYSYMYEGLEFDDFEPEFIIAVDVADTKLLGSEYEKKYGERIDLCIDHHGSNTLYAKVTCLHPEDAAAAQSIYRILRMMNVTIDKKIADCIYTGISTDTGCFRYSNTNASSHVIAAQMIDAGAANGDINVAMFETKTIGYFKLLSLAIADLTMHFNNLCSVILVSQEMFSKTGTDESSCEAISAIARQIEGVKIGITMREKKDGTYKFSVRTHDPVDAAAICKHLNGGGHVRAAGCESKKDKDGALAEILFFVEAELRAQNLL